MSTFVMFLLTIAVVILSFTIYAVRMRMEEIIVQLIQIKEKVEEIWKLQ